MGTGTVPPALISSPTHVWTPKDVILDSPVWRANIVHLEEQIEHFERWVDGFTKSLKQYIDAVKKYNVQLSNLCKKALPQNLDGSLIEMAGMIINTFASTLQCNLAFKTKMVSDLEETLLHPLQQFTRAELKDFKEERKAYERMVDRYEAQMYRYAGLSKSKEASALREDAFQTYEVRKSYTRLCRDYYVRIVAFKANLEHALVECFSSALATQVDEANEAVDSCAQTKTMLPGWRQWLEESKASSEYQLQKINRACLALENTYIRQTRPHRSLSYYFTVSNGMATDGNNNNNDERSISFYETYTRPSSVLGRSNSRHSCLASNDVMTKEGYLLTRITIGKPSRYSWVRRWFFLQDGWFGICRVSTVNRVKGCVVIGERVPIDEECKCASFNEIDRRFCFEITRGDTSFLVQAETEDEMQMWIKTFEKQRRALKQTPPTMLGQPLLSPREMLDVTEATHDGTEEQRSNKVSYVASNSPVLQALSLSTVNSGEDDMSATLTTAARLISVLLRCDSSNEEPLAAQQTPEERQPLPPSAGAAGASSSPSSSSWTMPWIMSALASSSSSSVSDVYFSSGDPYISSEDTGVVVIWPTKFEIEAPVVKLNGYTGELASRQRELRKLFANVPNDEIVLEAFSASLYRRGGQEMRAEGQQHAIAEDEEYGYSGHVYITPKNLWFYSCSMLTCINTLLVPLEDIQSVKLERALSAESHGMFMKVETSTTTLRFGVWLVSAEAAAERLRIAVQEAKKEPNERKDLQALLDSLRKVKRTKTKSMKPITNVTPVMATDTAITPVTVQAQQSSSPASQPAYPTTRSSAAAATTDNELSATLLESSSSSPPPPPPPSSFSSSSPSDSVSSSPPRRPDSAVNALTAAMEANRTKEQAQEQDMPCGCTDHLDKAEAQVQLKMSAKELFDLLFSEEQTGPDASVSKNIWFKLNACRNNSEPEISKWKVNSDGQDERQLKYTMPVNNPMAKARETDVVDIQQVVRKDPEKSYVVILTTKTPNLPYADAFLPLLKFCITSRRAEEGCTLICSAGIKWYKSIMVKSLVSRAAMKGMSETVQSLIPLIQQQQEEQDTGGTAAAFSPTTRRVGKSAKFARDHHSLESATTGQRSKPTLQHLLLTGVGRMFAVGVVLFLLWLRHGGSKTAEETAGIPSPCDQDAAAKQPMVWRAVFLRDLEPQLLGQNMTTINLDPHHVNPILYKAFLDSRKAEQRRTWFATQHQLMDNELSFTRGKIASLRFDLLTTFKALNDVDRALIENEYWNWVIDERKRCAAANDDNSCKYITTTPPTL